MPPITKKIALVTGAYALRAKRGANRMVKTYTSNQLSDPEVIARVIVKAVTVAKPKTRYVAGYMAAPALLVRRFLSDRMFDRIVSAMM